MNALVTGAAGYLGAAIVEALTENGMPVAATLRRDRGSGRQFSLANCTEIITNLEHVEATVHMLATLRPDVVFHCASAFPASADADEAERTDRRMLDNLLAAGTYTLLVIASTEMTRPGHAETAFQRAYAGSKRHLERRAMDHFQTTGTPVQIIRYPHLAGATAHARDRRQGRLLSRLIRSACGLTPDPIQITAPPEHVIRFAHVRSAAQATVDLARSCRTNQALSISHLPAISAEVPLAQLVACVADTVGTAPAVIWPNGSAPRHDQHSISPKITEMITDMVREIEHGGKPLCPPSSPLPSNRSPMPCVVCPTSSASP